MEDKDVTITIKSATKFVSLILGHRKLLSGFLDATKDVGYNVTLKWKFLKVSFSGN